MSGRIASAQFASPTCVPPNCNPSVIQNIGLAGTTQTASINIAGDAKIGSSLNLGAGTYAIPASGNYILANVASGGAGANLMNLQVGGATKFSVDLNGVTSVPIGSFTNPSYSFVGDNNTGMYSQGDGTIAFATNAVGRLVMNSGGVYFPNGVLTTGFFGSAAAPVYTFNTDTNTGMYRSAADTLNFSTNGTNRLQIDSAGAVSIPGNLTVTGTFSSTGGLSGSGAGLTNLNASQLTSGTVPSAAISGTYTNAVTFNNAANTFTGTYTGDGAALTNLNASNLATGTVPDGRLTGTYTGALTFSNAANSFTGVGTGLTALNGSNITTGTVATGRLPGTVVYTNTAQTISGAKIFSAATTALNGMTTLGLNTLVMSGSQNLLYGVVSNTSPGTTSLLKLESYNGTGYDPEFIVAPNGDTTINGTLNVSGTITGGGLASAAGTANKVAKFSGASTLGDSQIFDDGTKVGFGTATPAARFHVANGGNVVFDGVIAETPPTGTGTRFLWYPYYASFRAGRARDDRWDAGSIGWASAAFGDETRAKGNWSFAAGDRTFADGEGSVAFGIDSSADANSYGSAVFGYSRAVNADWALGAGSYNLITADYGVALGYNNAVSGMTSAAIGGTNLASGVVSFALGTCVTASAYTSFIFGNSTCVAGGGGVLNNNNDHSFMVGFDSSIPTVVIEGLHNVTVGTGPKQLTVNGQAHTGIAAGQEANDIDFNLARSVQWLPGAIGTQRAMVVRAPTYAFTGASTITNAATLAVTGAPVAGANATITNPYAFWVQAGDGRFDGNLGVGIKPNYKLHVGGNSYFGSGIGVGMTPDNNWGIQTNSLSAGGGGLYAQSSIAGTTAIIARANSSGNTALRADAPAVNSYGVYADATDVTGTGGYFRNVGGGTNVTLAGSVGGTPYAGHFTGNILATGTGKVGPFGSFPSTSSDSLIAGNSGDSYVQVVSTNATAARGIGFSTGSIRNDGYVFYQNAGVPMMYFGTNSAINMVLQTSSGHLSVRGALTVGNLSYPGAGVAIDARTFVGSIAYPQAASDASVFGGTGGTTYYNTATNKFRCNEGGTWNDCVLSGAVTGSGSANYLPKFASASTLGNSLVYDNGTNVGIGTASPIGAFALTVNEAVSGQGGIVIQGDGIGDNRIRMDNNTAIDGYIFQQATDGNRLVMEGETLGFNTNGANRRMSIDTAGNVGIGTTTPQDKLEVNGNIRIASGSGIKNSNGRTILESAWNVRYLDYTSIRSGYDWQDAVEPNAFTVGYDAFWWEKPSAAGTPNGGEPNANILMKLLTTGATAGNLGVGTYSPGEKVDVAGNIRSSGTIYSTYPGGYGQTQLQQWGLSSAGTMYIEPAGGSTLYLTDSWVRSGTLQVDFGRTYFASGNVGIGDSAPDFPLSFGTGLSHTKISLYDTGTGYSYGMGVVSGQFSFHIANNLARFAFYNDTALTSEVLTIWGNGDIVAPWNSWGTAYGWVLCGTGDCSCPGGYFVTGIWNRGDYVYCRQI